MRKPKNFNGIHVNLSRLAKFKPIMKEIPKRDEYTHHIYKNKERFRQLYLGHGMLIGGGIVLAIWFISLI